MNNAEELQELINLFFYWFHTSAKYCQFFVVRQVIRPVKTFATILLKEISLTLHHVLIKKVNETPHSSW